MSNSINVYYPEDTDSHDKFMMDNHKSTKQFTQFLIDYQTIFNCRAVLKNSYNPNNH